MNWGIVAGDPRDAAERSAVPCLPGEDLGNSMPASMLDQSIHFMNSIVSVSHTVDLIKTGSRSDRLASPTPSMLEYVGLPENPSLCLSPSCNNSEF